MAERIYINPEDDINSVIDKVIAHKDSTVEVVVPSGARILQNIVDAYLLRDASIEKNKNITIVTNDVMGKIFAERAGMSVVDAQPGDGDFFVTESMAKMTDIVPGNKNSRTQSSSTRKTAAKKTKATKKEEVKIVKKTKMSKAAKKAGQPKETDFLRSYKEDREASEGFRDLKNKRSGGEGRWKIFRLSTSKIIVITLLLALGIAGVVFGKVLPKATIIVYPIREAASFNVEVLIDQDATDIDIERGIIPGEVFLSEQSQTQEFTASGLEDVNTKAKGKIIIFNEYSSQPQTFIPSRFQADSGQIFWTTDSVVVPGAVLEDGKTTPGSVEASVIAAEPGEASNIGPTRFSMPALKGTERYDKIYAVSEAAISGGKTGQSVVVSADDLENAYKVLETRIAPDLEAFKHGLPEGMLLWDEAYNEEQAEKTANKEAGEPAETFSATLRTVARAIAFREADLETLLNQEINSRLTEEQTILKKSKEVTFLKPPVVDYQDGTIFATLHVTVDVIENLNAGAFRGAILRKNKDEIKQILPNFKGIERVEIKLWPFWVGKVPQDPTRVEVTIFGT